MPALDWKDGSRLLNLGKYIQYIITTDYQDILINIAIIEADVRVYALDFSDKKVKYAYIRDGGMFGQATLKTEMFVIMYERRNLWQDRVFDENQDSGLILFRNDIYEVGHLINLHDFKPDVEKQILKYKLEYEWQNGISTVIVFFGVSEYLGKIVLPIYESNHLNFMIRYGVKQFMLGSCLDELNFT